MSEHSAAILFESIGKGKENRTERPEKGGDTDRRLRQLVQRAREAGELIINVGQGYYRPILTRPEEVLETREFFAKEDARAFELLKRNRAMKRTFEQMTGMQMTFEEVFGCVGL